ncbi:MAG TPA: DUF2283 domain-containing protein, partial [Rhodothermales bacterium]|nr:DUF2283 domain-containing protein [Rhodothermales bacterium]
MKMKIEYFPETDTLSIIFAAGSFEATNEDELSDVLILRDGERIGEIVIEHASNTSSRKRLCIVAQGSPAYGKATPSGPGGPPPSEGGVERASLFPNSLP